jgi:LacI family transcriptional regulator
MTKSESVTVCDIAKVAGVTQTTVSSALHGTGRVSETTRQRIHRIATEMGYEPHLAAQLLRRRKTGQVGIIVANHLSDPFESPMHRRLIGHFISCCEKEGRAYHIGVHHHIDDIDGFRPPAQIAGRLVDGVILFGDVGNPLRQWLASHRDFPWVSVMEPADLCVLPAQDRGTNRIVEHLVALGHRRIAHIADNQQYMVHRQCHNAFKNAVESFGLDIVHDDWIKIVEDQNSLEGAQMMLNWVEQLLDRSVRPTAIIGAQRPAIYAALRRGLAIPGDISIVGWESPWVAQRDFFPSLTSIDVDPRLMFDAAWDLLMTKMAGKDPENPVRHIEANLRIGQTTGAPRKI